MSWFFERILLALFSVAATLLFVEVAVRLVGLEKPPKHLKPQGMYLRDPELGHVLAPNISVMHESADWVTRVSTNSFGFRDREVGPKGPHTFRILSLGDSYTFGYGVEAGDSYPEQLERFLNERAGKQPRFDVINAGVSGYGTIQEFLQLRRHVEAINPDLVILGFFTGNDFENNLTFLGRFNRKFSGVGGWAADHVRLAAFLERTLKNAEIKMRTAESLDVALDVIADFARLCKERGTPFAMMIITPPRANLAEYHSRNSLRLTLDRAFGANPLRLLEEFKKRTQTLGIPILDTLELLQGMEDKGKLSFPVSGHWTPLAHRIVALKLRDWLVERGLVRP